MAYDPLVVVVELQNSSHLCPTHVNPTGCTFSLSFSFSLMPSLSKAEEIIVSRSLRGEQTGVAKASRKQSRCYKEANLPS